MRSRTNSERIIVGGSACAVVIAGLVACGTKGELPKTTPTRSGLTFSPSCGKAGDVVTVQVPDSRVCEDVHILRFHPGVQASTSAGATSSDGASCTLTTRVPDPAVSGKIAVQHRDETIYESADAFQVPCPEDAGQPLLDAAADVTPPEDLPPLGAVVVQERYADSTLVNLTAYSFPQGMTDAQKAELPAMEASERLVLQPPGVAVGTCAPLVEPAPGPNKPPLVYRGPFTVNADGNVVAGPLECGPDFVYRGSYDYTSFVGAVIWDASFGGTRTEDAFVIPGTGTKLDLSITSPTIVGAQADVAQGPLQVAWSPNVAVLMTIILSRQGQTPIACAVDPKAGSFTVPANAVGGPGTVDMYVAIGDIRKEALTLLTLSVMWMTIQNQLVTLNVQ